MAQNNSLLDDGGAGRWRKQTLRPGFRGKESLVLHRKSRNQIAALLETTKRNWWRWFILFVVLVIERYIVLKGNFWNVPRENYRTVKDAQSCKVIKEKFSVLITCFRGGHLTCVVQFSSFNYCDISPDFCVSPLQYSAMLKIVWRCWGQTCLCFTSCRDWGGEGGWLASLAKENEFTDHQSTRGAVSSSRVAEVQEVFLCTLDRFLFVVYSWGVSSSF